MLKGNDTVNFRGKAKVRPADVYFLLYQTKWINDASRIKLMQKARQIGLSLSTAYRAVDQAASANAHQDIWVSSRDDLQAKLFIEDCKHFADILGEAYKHLGIVIKNDGDESSYHLTFANGNTIHSLSSNADAQAGKRGSRILDEFALHPDPRKLYGIAYPGITWGGNLEIISTHRGSDNFFNKLVQEAIGKNPKKISLHTVTLQDALEQGFLFKLQSKLSEGAPESEILDMDEAAYFEFIRSQCSDEETFQQEYMCKPSDDSAAFLTYEMIAKCQYRTGEDWEKLLSSESDLFLGVDVGRQSDRTTMWLLERMGGVLYTRAIRVLHKMKFSEQENVLDEYMANPRVRRAAIDNTGLGMQFAERAQERYGEHRVDPVTFTAGNKEKLAFPVKSDFEDVVIRIPQDRDVEADLRKVKKEVGLSGNIRFTAERDSDGHADRFWALALARYAASTQTGYSAIEGIANFNGRVFL